MSWNCFNVNVRFAPIAKSSLADLANHPRDNTRNIKHYGGVGAAVRGGRIVQYRNLGERGYPRRDASVCAGVGRRGAVGAGGSKAQTALPDINVISTTPLSGTRSPQRSVAPPAPVRPARATRAEPATPGTRDGRPDNSRPNDRTHGTGRPCPATPAPVPPIQGPAASGEISRDKVPSNTEVITSRGIPARQVDELPRHTEPKPPRRLHRRPVGQPVPARRQLPRLRRLAGAGHAAGARGLPERRAHQRSLWRRRQLGLHPGDVDPQALAGAQQSRSTASTPSAARSPSR